MRPSLHFLLFACLTCNLGVHAAERPVQVAATQLGGFFQRLFDRDKADEPKQPADATTTGPALDLSRFTQLQMSDAVKQALGQGITNALTQLGSAGGFLTNQAVRIEMPERLRKIEAGLRRYGQDAIADGFVNTLNRAAEQAVTESAPIFKDALNKLTVEEAARILSGPDNAATDYFRRTTSAELTRKLREKVSETTAKVGLTNAYKELTSRLRFGTLFLNYDVEDLDNYVTSETLDGLFTVIAEEEKKIRKDPVARGSQLLQSVFGSLLQR